jgi:hypothetical protein
MKPSTERLLNPLRSIKDYLLVMLSCVVTFPSQADPLIGSPLKNMAEINIRYEARSGKMSINAADVTIAELAAKLEAAYQILLFVTDVSLDTKVTCDVRDKFIDDALREALPPASHFFYRFKKGDAEVEDRRPEAKQSGARIVSPGVKARLQAQAPAAGIQAVATPVTAKRIARTATIIAPVQGGAMPLRIAPAAIRAQQLVQPVTQQSDDYYVKVVVKVTPAGYEPVSYTKVKGRLTEDSTAGGDFLYQLKDEGRSVYTGSFQDPLALHSYAPDGQHEVLQAKEAYINITLPPQVLDRNMVRTPSLEFSKIRGEAIPDNRNIKLLPAAALQRKGVISADALKRIMPGQ